MPIRAVFFDLDDTLCNTIGTREARARRAFEALRRERPNLDGDAFVSRVMEPAGPLLVRGVPAVVNELGLALTPGGRDALALWYFVGCAEMLRPIDGVPETVAALGRDYTLGIISNGDGPLQRAKLDALGLGIEHVVISAEIGCEKPDPRIFRHALSLAGVGAREAVFVGDRLDVDVGGAKASGMRAVWFNHWGGTLNDAATPPDAIIRHFDQLPAVLATI